MKIEDFKPDLRRTELHKDATNYACTNRLPLHRVSFDAMCKDCVEAAIGYLDAGMDKDPIIRPVMSISDGNDMISMPLEDFVRWAQYWAKELNWW